MLNVSIARRYARALLELATESGTAEPVLASLEVLARAFVTLPELEDIFVNPAYSSAQRGAVVDQLLQQAGSADPSLHNMMRLLNDRGRMMHLPGIARMFRDMADERAGRVRGKVTTAVPLTKEALQRLEKSLERETQKAVVLEQHHDPAVLGGVAAQVGSKLFDGTLRHQMEELRRQLKGQ